MRLLLKQAFTAFNANVQSRQADIEAALDSCSHIKLVVPYTGDGISKTASDALQALLDDEDLDEERLHKQVTYYTAAEIVRDRSEEHTSELQSLMRISYAVFCLKKKKKHINKTYRSQKLMITIQEQLKATLSVQKGST